MRLAFVLAPFLGAATLAAQDTNPLAGDAAAIEQGRETFRGACGACHGPGGTGGTGPSLVRGQQVSRANDRQLFNSIRGGVKGTDMPPFPNFNDTQLWQLVSFIRSLSVPAVLANLPGDPAAGRAVFQSAGCKGCHVASGDGGLLGPDLTDLGAQRSVDQIREAILKPNARIEPGFAKVTARLRDGRVIDGVTKNANNYSVQIVDGKGNLHLLWRKDITRFEQPNVSAMPANYAERLDAAQQRDLLAYLGRQTIRPPEPAAVPARKRR